MKIDSKTNPDRKNRMLVRQAIVASPSSRALKENELIARSVNVDDDLAQTLCQWSPGRNELAYGLKQSINFCQTDADTFALSRTVIGGWDEVRRIVTQFVLFGREQLIGNNNNIALVAHVLRTSGMMILPSSVSHELPLLEVPESAFAEKGEYSQPGYENETERIVHAIDIHHKVVVLGLKNPLAFMCSFLAAIPPANRLDFGFTTGLKVNEDRPISIQFFPQYEAELMEDLASRHIRTISLESSPIARS